MNQAWTLKILERGDEMNEVVNLQRIVWPGSEMDVVPVHILLASVHSGGLLVGAYIEERLVGFVYGFPGLDSSPMHVQSGTGVPRLKHHSHMLAVHPDFRSHGIGFALKRAQWQMVRRQGIERITWTYDPLLSRNAWLNITKLGAVCNTYLENFYGEMQDGVNKGLPSDRFQVDWWLNSRRVNLRLSKRKRKALDLAHYLSAGTDIINTSRAGFDGWAVPPEQATLPAGEQLSNLLLVEIPADINGLKAAYPSIALNWRLTTRSLFTALFNQGYLVTDFVHLPGTQPRSFYVVSHGEATLS